MFLAVAGAIYVDHGILTMQNWLGQLVYGESYAEETAPPEPASAMPPQKKQKFNRGRGRSTRPPEYQADPSNSSGPLQPPPPAVFPVPGPNQFIPAAAPPPVPNAVAPPPMVMPPAPASAPTPAPPNNGRTFLLAFHEHAVKRGVRVEYEVGLPTEIRHRRSNHDRPRARWARIRLPLIGSWSAKVCIHHAFLNRLPEAL